MQYRELHFAGREFTVLFSCGLIEALQNEILRASTTPGLSEPGGLLLGRGNEGAAIVSRYVPLTGPDAATQDNEEFWKQLQSSLQKQTGQLEILGYYRPASDAEPVPQDRDLRVMKEFLPESASMLLLISTSQGVNTGSLFIWEDRSRYSFLRSKSKVQFPKMSCSEISARQGASQLSGSVSIATQAQFSKNPSPRMRRILVQSVCRSLLVWVLAICIVAVPVGYVLSKRQHRPKKLPDESSVKQQQMTLALAAKIEKARLRVTWDAASPMLASAVSGVLSVVPKSGTPDTQVLSRDQLMSGSVVSQVPPGYAKIRLMVFTEEVSELAPGSFPEYESQVLAPTEVPAKPEMVAAAAQNPQRVARTGIDSPGSRPVIKRREKEVNRMTVGFKDESWRDRYGAQAGGISGFVEVSNSRIPPRPIRLVQPDRYYSLYPFTVDSVQINVRVKIDSSGEVASTEPLSWGNALLNHLSRIAVKAARESTFMPARFGDRKVPSTAVLSYRFLRRK